MLRRVDINVGDPGTCGGPLGDLVHAPLGGDAGPMSRNWPMPAAARNRTARPEPVILDNAESITAAPAAIPHAVDTAEQRKLKR